MKKIIALILCLAMMLGCAAVAEEAKKENIGKVSVNGDFNIKGVIPEGYKLSIIDSDSSIITATITTEDPTKPWMTLNIAFNDTYTQDGKALRLNDVSEEEIALIQESFQESMTDPTFEFRETGLGTRVMLIRGTLGGVSLMDFYSIYNSYEFDMVVIPGEGAEDKTLPDEIVDMVLNFMTQMDFEET